MNPCNSNRGDREAQEPQGQIDMPARQRNDASGWLGVADKVLPTFMQALNGALADINRSAARSQDQVELIVAQHVRRWGLPSELFRTVLAAANSFCEEIRTHSANIEHSLSHAQPVTAHVVFHHGRSEICDGAPPAEITALRRSILFWIDHSTGEMYSRGRPVDTGAKLQPKAEELLRCLCQAEHAGRTVSFLDIYGFIWGTQPPPPEALRNNINVQQNAINTFAAEKFILAASSDSQHDEKKILRLRGKAAYTIGNRAYEELCIIKAIHGQ